MKNNKDYKKEIEKMGYIVTLGNGKDFNKVKEPFISKITGRERLIDFGTSTYDDTVKINQWLKEIYEMLKDLNK